MRHRARRAKRAGRRTRERKVAREHTRAARLLLRRRLELAPLLLVALHHLAALLHALRELCANPRTRALPLLMLTARGEALDRIVGLELGADDYLPKPFEPRELLARIQTILRRQRSAPAAAAANAQLRVFDGLSIDLDRRQVLRHGERVELTGTEFDLLALLAGEPGKVFSRDDILNRLRGHEAELFTRAVDIVVSRLRKKLEPLDCIKTLRNAGYALAVAPGEPSS